MISESALDHLRGLLSEPEADAAGGADGVDGEDAAQAAGATVTRARYEVLTTLGRGGMGTVYLARDTALDREVALKVLERESEQEPSPAAAPTIAARLAQEARILGRLEHPGIVPVHDFGRLPDGRLFYAMKRVRGERLDRWMAGVPVQARLAVFLRICEAASFAHAHGVIHRDLKPENVMIGEFGEVLVLDWGVARLLNTHEAAHAPDAPRTPATPGSPVPLARTIETAHGTVIGTPAFMAPEQARGEVAGIDQRTDIYALGAMLNAMVNTPGASPGSGAGTGAGALRAIIAKACAERPADRYQTVQELAADVSRFVSGVAVHARGEPVLDRVRRLATRYRTPLLLILTYLIARLLLFWAFRV